tara:strand:+ start:5479 stop:6957 length:1479 start_codon:yes stop_codon:yes gene_type:complete
MEPIEGKRKIFAKLSAVKALGKVQRAKVNSSISSVNNKLNSTDFLVDLTTALVGARALKDFIVDTITHGLPLIEEVVKEGLKTELKKITSCGVNPSIPSWLRHGGTGVELKVTDVDFFDRMKINPESTAGSLVYTDTARGVDSEDFNTYLYNTIQTPLKSTNWGMSVANVDILTTEFTNIGTTNNNVIKYTTSVDYSSKKLSDFNNDLIDSLSLFGSPGSASSGNFIGLILEELFGSISATTGKSKKQIESELRLKESLTCILESENDFLEDSFFTFDNPTLARIDRESNDRKNGVRELKTCGNVKVSAPSNIAVQAIKDIDATTTKAEEASAVTNSLNSAAEAQSNSVSSVNKETVKTNFFIEIIKKLQIVVLSSIMTPEFISLFAINHQIIHGKGTSYDGPIDFIKSNKKLFKSIGKIILEMLLNKLLNLVLSNISKLLTQKLVDDKVEQAKNYVSILLSLQGVSPKIIAQIRKINSPPVPNLNNLNVRL